jgi:hypothetical protein
LEKIIFLQQDVHKLECVLTWLWDFLKYGQGHDKVGIDSLYQQNATWMKIEQEIMSLEECTVSCGTWMMVGVFLSQIFQLFWIWNGVFWICHNFGTCEMYIWAIKKKVCTT